MTQLAGITKSFATSPMLNPTDSRKQAHDYVEQLSPERLAVVLDFLAYLVEREDNDATTELLAIPGFTTELEAAEQEADAGELTDWRMIRSDVQSQAMK